MAEIENGWMVAIVIFLMVVSFIVGALLFRRDCPVCPELEEIDCDSDEMYDDEEEECVTIECPPLYVFDKDLAKCIPT